MYEVVHTGERKEVLLLTESIVFPPVSCGERFFCCGGVAKKLCVPGTYLVHCIIVVLQFLDLRKQSTASHDELMMSTWYV